MDAVLKRIVSSPSFIRMVAEFMKLHVHSNIGRCRLMQLYAESGKAHKQECRYSGAGHLWTQRKSLKTAFNAKAPNMEAVKKKNAHRDGSDRHWDRSRASLAAQGH